MAKKKNFMGELQGYVIGSAVMVIAIVLVNLILLSVKTMSGVTSALNTTIDNALTAINSPVTYIGLIILVVIFVFLLKLFTTKLGNTSD